MSSYPHTYTQRHWCGNNNDDAFSLWNIIIEEVIGFSEQANRHHPTIKFTAEVSARRLFPGHLKSVLGSRWLTVSLARPQLPRA